MGAYDKEYLGSICPTPTHFLKPSKWYFPKIRVPQYRSQNTIILNMGTPKKVHLILGNSQIPKEDKLNWLWQIPLSGGDGLDLRGWLKVL